MKRRETKNVSFSSRCAENGIREPTMYTHFQLIVTIFFACLPSAEKNLIFFFFLFFASSEKNKNISLKYEKREVKNGTSREELFMCSEKDVKKWKKKRAKRCYETFARPKRNFCRKSKRETGLNIKAIDLNARKYIFYIYILSWNAGSPSTISITNNNNNHQGSSKKAYKLWLPSSNSIRE